MVSPRLLIGLSIGSGADAVDAVLIQANEIGLSLQGKWLHGLRKPLPPELRLGLLQLAPGSWPSLHRQLGEIMAITVNQLLLQSGVSANRILAIGVLGPFAWHEPGGRHPSSHELGMVSLLADRLGITIISDFREQDVATGGQGMPQSALADSLLFRHPTEERLLLHLGGVTSLVWLKAAGRVQDLVAFETGPGTRLLDTVIRQGTGGREMFDPGGRYAVQGKCLEPLIENWLREPYFSLKPPKSLPRSAFGQEFVLQAVRQITEQHGVLQDLLCSLSHFVIRSVIWSCREWLPDVLNQRPVWISGGGSRNGMLWRILEGLVPFWELKKLDDLGVPALSRSSVVAGILAALTLDGVPSSTPTATGAVGRMLGRITPGSPQNWARCLRWMVHQAHDHNLPHRAA